MANSKSYFIRKTVAMSILLAAYFFSTLLQSEAWSNILSPVNAFVSAAILLFAYLRSERTAKLSVTLLMYAFACIVWGIADTLWAIIGFSGGAPNESPAIWIIYALTNCFLLASLVVFVVQQFKKWDIVQFCIDLLISGFLTVELFWVLFLHKDFTILNELLASDFTSVLSILTDILICISVFSLLLSVRTGKMPDFMLMFSFGMILYALVDMLYYYMNYNGFYFPGSLNDFLYILSLNSIAFGALWKTYKNSLVHDLTAVTNMGGRLRWVYLLLYPGTALLCSVTGIINVQLNITDIIIFAIPIFFYWASCKYIQISLEKEALLKNNNEILERRVAEQVSELKFLADQDTLTTLFNRRYFITCLNNTLENKCPDDLLALLMIDMDRFKMINDTLGHDIGDMVLIDLSHRMIEWNNYGATIARLGGDEFAIMFAGKYTKADIEDFCVQLVELCSRPISVDGNLLNLTMSVGIALASKDVTNGKTLIQNADIAMYRSKSQGYNKYMFYDSLMSADFKKTVEIEILLRQTQAEKDFELFYQPQYSLPDKKLIGAEALIRWKNPEHGYIPPSVFIPIAEQIDYIFKIGKWVMQETIRQSIMWNKMYNIPLKIGFNISPKQLNDGGFVSLVKTLVSDSGVNPDWIDAEITESIMMNDENTIDNVFFVLKELGITVSIDDFGSGYSSLRYLNKYTFDRIKIDKALIGNINTHNISGANVVRAAISMAHASGIQTIAEGVETREQLDVLIESGCDQVQGYFLGRPVPADMFEKIYINKYMASEEKIALACL